MATARMRRINEVLREVIGAAIGELGDPRIGFTFPVLILIFRPRGLLGGEIGRARI